MANQIHSTKLQDKAERNVLVLCILVTIVVSIGGIVQIVPLFFLNDVMESDKKLTQEVVVEKNGQSVLVAEETQSQELLSVRPYTPLEHAGRDVYIREGCYTCHSQMIRPLREEVERYGHFSLAVESQYDHPFLWGSKRTGPDLARVGGKYSDEWHRQHLIAPRSVVPESTMPSYPWLAQKTIDTDDLLQRLRAFRALGVPLGSDEQLIAEINKLKARTDAEGRTIPAVTELDALVAYLQVLGTMIQFEPGKIYRD